MDEAAVPFEELYARHADPVYRFCFSLLRDAADAEDVAATSFLSAYSAYERVRPPATEVKAWLFRIARNASIDQMRGRERRQRLLGVLRLRPRDRGDVEAAVLERGELRDVIEAMAALRRRDRELVGLRVAGELSFAEIGVIVGMSEQAAKTATRRALARVVAGIRGTP